MTRTATTTKTQTAPRSRGRRLEFDVRLSARRREHVVITLRKVRGTVLRKIKVDGKTLRISRGPRAGQPETRAIKVPSVVIELHRADGSIVTARSCCKPPDRYDSLIGRKLAVGHLFRQPGAAFLTRLARTAIMFAVCPEFRPARAGTTPSGQRAGRANKILATAAVAKRGQAA